MQITRRFIHSPSARYPECHAASIAALPDGALIASWYAGAYERAKDVVILGARLTPGAADWEPLGVFAETPGRSEGNTVLWCSDDGELLHVNATIQGEDWPDCDVKLRRSRDGGRTWSAPEPIRDAWGWVPGCKPIEAGGALLLPMYEETGASFVLRSTDRMRTWTESNHVTTRDGVIQPTLLPRTDGSILMLMRTYEPEDGNVFASQSRDGGRTWSDPERTELPNPNARIDGVRMRDGRFALAFNDTPRGRTPLTLALSGDEGRTWPQRVNIEAGEGEYSYPAMVEGADGVLHCAYTWRRTHIAHVEWRPDAA